MSAHSNGGAFDPTPGVVVEGGKIDHATTGIGDGHKEVTTAGTAVTLAASTSAKWVTLQADPANTGYIAYGGSTVNASGTTGTGRGHRLAAG